MDTDSEVRIIFPGDLSASCVSEPIWLPEGTRSLDIDIAWPDTGTPVGSLTIEECIHGDANGDWLTYTADGVTPITVPVAGTTDVAHIRDVEIKGPKVARLRWTRISGGDGAEFYDGSPDLNRRPVVIFAR